MDLLNIISPAIAVVLLLIILPQSMKAATSHELEEHAKQDAKLFEEIRKELYQIKTLLITISRNSR